MRALAWLLLLLPTASTAYPWMVKSGITSCAACHVDPSGAGQLTRFGRTEAEALVRWRPAGVAPAPRNENFLWFAELPAWLNLSGNVRFGALVQPGAARPVVPLEMASDLSATVSWADRVMAHGTVGFGRRDVVAPAIVTPACEPAAVGECGPSLLARAWWLGVRPGEGAVLVRAGRLPLPFGLRNNEHNAWVRSLTLTDTNVHQKLGAAISLLAGGLRVEVMGIAGATLRSADEAGYSALAEWRLAPTTTLGLSSLFASRPTASGVPNGRHAHGAFLRAALLPSLVLLAEADVLAAAGVDERVGYAAFVQGDYEPVQGLHLMLTAESAHRGEGLQRGPSFGGWVSAAWYFFSHFELRVDALVRRVDALTPLAFSLVAQLHLFL